MKVGNILKIVIMLLILIVLISTSIVISFAATASELQEQASSLDDQIAETSSEIAGVKSQMTEALTQINRLNSQISSYESEITELESNLETLEAEIAEKEASIAEEQEKYDEQQKLLNKRIIALYESGSTSYLDMLLNADGLADFVSKYYLISQLAEYDQELLQKIETSKTQLETEKAELEESKSELENSKQTLTAKKNSLSVSVSDKNTLVSTLTTEEQELEEQLEAFEKEKKAVQAEIAALAKQKNYTTTVTPSAAGYISPLAGKTKANITTGYYGYSGHTGVDFACSSGTPILAVKSGTVVKSKASMSGGVYVSYGEYIIIDHGDGTMTLYAHGLAGSRLVSVGDTVSQGQQIMSVGSTGNSTGPHLHFEVFVNGSRVNPTSYLP